MSERELQELAEDIQSLGLRDPIVTYEGKILDGKHRYLACGMAGVKPRFVAWDGNGSPARYVWSRNFARRHMTVGQKAMAVLAFEETLAKEAKERQCRGSKLTIQQGVVANLPQGPDDHGNGATVPVGEYPDPLSNSDKGRTREKLAEMAGVSPRLLQDAKLVQGSSPEKYEQVKKGELSVHRALKQIKDSTTPPHIAHIGDDHVTMLVASSLAVRKAALPVVGLTAAQLRNAAGLAKAINTIGFVFAQLLPLLVRTGDHEAIALARVTIGELTKVTIDQESNVDPATT